MIVVPKLFEERLRELAHQQNRSPEEVLASLLETALGEFESSDEETVRRPARTVEAVKSKAYAKARLYWRRSGESERAALTDEELADQFIGFDHEGIPRLKADGVRIETKGTLTELARLSEVADIRTENPLDPDLADAILRDELGAHKD